MSTVYVLIDDKGHHKYTQTFYELDADKFRKLNDEGWGVYFSVNDFEATPEQMQEAGVKTSRNIQFLNGVRAVFADLDIAKAGDGMIRSIKEANKNTLAEALLNCACPPSKIIDTSNGLQPLWELVDSSTDPEYQDRYVNVINGIIQWSKQHGAMGDEVKDVTRVLRLPGYSHMKEEPYPINVVTYDHVYKLEDLEKAFPHEAPKKYVPKPVNNQKLDLISQEINRIDFQELILRAFAATGRSASFDKKGRLELDGRLTGTFQGKKGDRDYLASTSHEPYEGNRITAVADILGTSNKDARKWIIETYNLSLTGLIKQKKKAVKAREYKPYTWGTNVLDQDLWPMKRGQYILLFGEQNSGKTAYTFDLAKKNAEDGQKVLFISLEMDTEEIYDRACLEYAGYTQTEVRLEKYPESKVKKFNEKKKELKSISNLELFGFAAGVSSTIESILQVIDEKDPDLVVIDNLDKVKADIDARRDKHEFISGEILTYCKNSGPPIILVHHVRKRFGKDKSIVRGMDEIRGSGKISDDAYYVVQVSRNTDEKADPYEKSQFRVFQMKNRMSGQSQMRTIFHFGGSFYDQYVPDNYLKTDHHEKY